MEIIDTSTMDPDALSPDHTYWVYNGLDCCLTLEIKEKLEAQLDDTTGETYAQAMRIQAPFLDMMLRGLLVDERNRDKAIDVFEKREAQLVAQFDRLCMEGLGFESPVNPGSHIQVKHLFYEVLDLPVVKKRNSAGVMAPASDRETLEMLGVLYHFAQPFVNHILAIRDQRKSLGFLRTPLDKDHRIRCNFNIAGTNTGRLSSSFSDFGTGTNLQNVDSALRYVFVADEGKVLVNIDLEQADSRNVGALCWDYFLESHGPEFAGSYLDACESGDLHTTVSRMAYTHLPWGTEKDRAIADLIAYRDLSYRDLSKKLGHGTNYYGQPPTMAKHSKLPVSQIVDFQRNYFGAFPCIPEFHKHTIHLLQTTGQLTHLFGRRRTFFGRLDQQSVINAAIAYCPQGMTGEEINHGVLQLWRDPRFELLVQVHDSIMFQIDQREINTLVPLALELLKAPITLRGGREFYVPLEAMVGWNWGYYNDEPKKGPINLEGLKKWTGEELRKPPRRLKPVARSIRSLL